MVGSGGSTGAVHERSLGRIRDLADRVLVDLRLRLETPLHPEALRLAHVVDEIVSCLENEVNAQGVLLGVAIDREIELRADRQLLTAALANVVQNAVACSVSGAVVQIKGHVHDGRIGLEVKTRSDMLGDRDLDNASKALFRLLAKRPGTGLGLFIAEQAVEKLGSRIDIRGGRNKELVFSLSLPAA